MSDGEGPPRQFEIQPSHALGFRHFLWFSLVASLFGLVVSLNTDGQGTLPCAVLLGSTLISLSIVKSAER